MHHRDRRKAHRKEEDVKGWAIAFEKKLFVKSSF